MKAVLLDMYGVIMKDSTGGFVSFMKKSFPDLAREEYSPIWNQALIGQMTSQQLFHKLGFTGDLHAAEMSFWETIEINESFYAFADRITKHHKLALISDDVSEWSQYIRNKYKINSYFDVISVSGDVKVRKPDERIFQMTMDSLGCEPSECVFVDDRRHYLAGAQALGIDTVLFNSRKVEPRGKTVNNFEELYELLETLK